MIQEKTYILTAFYCGKATEVKRGPKALLIWMRSQLRKDINYRNSKLTIISEDGLKYNKEYIKP